MLIGHVKEITRYPVKSFQGESVNKTQVMDYGLYGDRSHAFKDESREDKFLTITQCRQMAQYKAAFSGAESLDAFPPLTITQPDGEIKQWGDPVIQKDLEALSGRPLSLVRYSPGHVPLGAIEEAHLLMITSSSLNELSKVRGGNVDGRRFRPNLVIELLQDQPYSEENWLGKTLVIGKQVEIHVTSTCTRCMIITVHPDSAEKDPSLLAAVAKERNNQFGVYASVIQSGEIRMGDEIRLKE
ncbi:MOSC domain-containing protein [Jeotgalibacillus sp. ET6]|uniref:MOSC domain-containing protein n=1 Tax=Jeotgalibacillus sp. ET6 TaxID=3037260 RepID=UPI00241874B9|nr:MOSC domain-containing protein [Jeotgalibacillus sp. ET6]MDG5471907.1 MOSC domain-containing protein [Jeotgalibacillus sp. ET6]